MATQTINPTQTVNSAAQSINATLLASSHPDVAKRTSVPKLTVSVVMLLVGVLLFASIFRINDHSSTVSMALMVLGTACVLLGIFRLFWKSKALVYLPTGSVTEERSLFFDLKYLGKLTELIEEGKLNEASDVPGNGGGNVRMDVMMSQDNQFVAVQLFQFVPYTYSPVTPVHYFTGGEAESVAAFCRHIGMKR